MSPMQGLNYFVLHYNGLRPLLYYVAPSALCLIPITLSFELGEEADFGAQNS